MSVPHTAPDKIVSSIATQPDRIIYQPIMQVSPTIQSVNRLGLNLLYHLSEKASSKGLGGEIAVSPASIHIALSMLAGGADADDGKARALWQALGGTKPTELNDLFLKLQDCNDTTSLANAMFTDNAFKVNPDYTAHLQGFSADVKSNYTHLVDAVDEINGWVSKKTKGMITDVVNAGLLSSSHLVLLNALAFKGLWKDPFCKDYTRKTPFYPTESTTVEVEMMFKPHQYILSYETSLYRAACLPYEATHSSGATSFVAYLPNPNRTINQVLASIPPSQTIRDFRHEKFDSFGLPKMELSHGMELLPVLQELQFPMPAIFPNMGSGPSQVQNIIHKATVSVDEEGTRAAAVTAVAMKCCIRDTNELIFNRPFVFSIIVNDTGAVLMTGVFTPRSEV